MTSIYPGIREIAYELFKSQLPIKRRLFRVAFRFQTIRNFFRWNHDIKFDVPKKLEESDALSLKKSGYVVKNINITDSFMNEIHGLSFIEDISKKKFNNFSEVINYQGKRAHSRYVANSCHKMSKEVLSLSKSPEILDLVYSYLGPNAELRESVCWVSMANVLDDKNFEYGFHMDIASWKWLNVFVYLSDVNIENGAHSCIDSTHEKRHFLSFLDRRLDYDRATKEYDESRFKVFTGKAGTAIFEDTGNYHRAMPVKEGYRLMLQLNYSNYSNFAL